MLRTPIVLREIGPNHLRIGHGLNNPAESLYRHALEIQERILGPGHPDVAETLRNYAAVLEELAMPIMTHSGVTPRQEFGDHLGIYVTEVTWWPARLKAAPSSPPMPPAPRIAWFTSVPPPTARGREPEPFR